MSDRPPPGEHAPSAGAARGLRGQPDQLIEQGALSKLKWRCRRGLLENDLYLERFFDRHSAGLTVGEAEALGQLMELDDNDLLDLLLRRRDLPAEINTSEVRHVLEMLRARGASPDVAT